jgi:hypothetical protein
MACEPVRPIMEALESSKFWIGFVAGVIVTLLVQWILG